MNAKRFSKVTRQYGHLSAAIVGDFFLDRYLHIDPARNETSIETGLTVYNVVQVRSQPGAAGTILNNLVALGIKEVFAVGFCGDDGEGYELRQVLAAGRGVNLRHFVTTSTRRTPVYCKPLILEPGEPPRELNRFDSKNWTPTPTDLKRELADRTREVANHVDVLLLLDQVDMPETGVVTDLVKDAARAVRRTNDDLITLADSRRGLGDFPPVGWKMNAAEFARMMGGPLPELDLLLLQVSELSHITGQPVFITLAESGIVGAVPGSEPEHLPAQPVRGPIDIVGAGDAVTANLAVALAAEASLREAMELAMAAASVVIHQVGTTGTASVPQLGELLIQS